MQVMKLSKKPETVLLEQDQHGMLNLATGMNLGANSKSGILALALREWMGRNPKIARMYKLMNEEALCARGVK